VAAGPAAARRLEIVGAGDAINVTDELRAAVARTTDLADLTSRTIHGYFTASLAAALGLSLTLADGDSGRLVVAASPSAFRRLCPARVPGGEFAGAVTAS
jgi:hypothetical protein